jgi:lysozyme family protein
MTMTAVRRIEPADLVLLFNAERLRFYTKLKKFDIYGRGWTNRIANNLEAAAADN